MAAAAALPDGVGAELLTAARAAFTDGLNTVAGLGAVLFLALAVLAAVVFRHIPPHGPTNAVADAEYETTADPTADADPTPCP